MKSILSVVLLAALSSVFFAGCATTPAVQQQAYAKLKNQRTFEYEFPAVWKGIEDTVRNYRVVNRDPKDVNPNEMRRLRDRTLDTDWIFTKSNDKYVEYKVNGLPRKIYLQTRLKYNIEAQSVIGGVTVTVKTIEEVEKLKNDGSPDGWQSAYDDQDTARASDLLDRINMAILSAGPTSEVP